MAHACPADSPRRDYDRCPGIPGINASGARVPWVPMGLRRVSVAKQFCNTGHCTYARRRSCPQLASQPVIAATQGLAAAAAGIWSTGIAIAGSSNDFRAVRGCAGNRIGGRGVAERHDCEHGSTGAVATPAIRASSSMCRLRPFERARSGVGVPYAGARGGGIGI